MKTNFKLLSLTLFLAIASPCLSPAQDAQENEAAKPAAEQRTPPSMLSFSFTGANWRDVLIWIADEAELSLQLDVVPVGTFTYSDPTRTYSVSEALDVINYALMKRNYAIVQRGRLLQVIDLEMKDAEKLISEIAELVKPEQLDSRGRTEILSCVFSLGSIEPDAAKEELPLMIGPWGRVVVMESANKVKVTETSAKLVSIRDMLEETSTKDTTVVEIVLENRGADELLEVARPLLGLEPGENSSDDLRISVGLYGDRIYAAGAMAKVGLLRSFIEKADRPIAVSSDTDEVALPVFQTHPVSNADITIVFDVLQTMLDGTPDARVAIEPSTNSIIARVRPDTHKLISETIAQMESRGRQFKMFTLKRLDPAQALLTINKYFGVSEEGDDGPVVDGDPATGKLWVRGTQEQIDEVEKLLEEYEGEDSLAGLGDKVRILPYTGRAAEDAVMQVQELWPVTGRRNEIRSITPSRSNGGIGMPERHLEREVPAPRQEDEVEPVKREVIKGTEAREADSTNYQLVSERDEEVAQVEAPTQTYKVGGSDIVVQHTPAGMIIASEDLEALDVFQSLLESVAAPNSMQSDLPTILWLKYIKADVAAELVANVLGGAESAVSSVVDSAVGGLGGGMLGMLGGLGGGASETSSAKSILTTTGSVNIVPDLRLNALIIQANPTDMQMIEVILAKVDRQESPEDIETVAKPQLVQVIYQDAKSVMEVVKSIFGDRIEGAQSSGGNARGGGGGGGQPSPQDFLAALRGGGRGGRGGGGDTVASEPNKISLAVDETSNAIVVRATPQDFVEVRDLIRDLDLSSQPNGEIIDTYTPDGSLNPEVLRLALESILGQTTKSTSEGGSSSSNAGGNDSNQQQASEISRRIEAFRALRGAGGGGGGPGGGGFGGRGGGGFGGGGGIGGRGGGGPGGGGPGGGRRGGG